MPTLPTPWESADRRVVDANGREVLAVAEWLTGEQQDQLTAYIADTMNRAYGQQRPVAGGCNHAKPDGTRYRCTLIAGHVGPHTAFDHLTGKPVVDWRNEADA